VHTPTLSTVKNAESGEVWPITVQVPYRIRPLPTVQEKLSKTTELYDGLKHITKLMVTRETQSHPNSHLHRRKKCYLQKTQTKKTNTHKSSFPAVVCICPHHLEYCTCKHIYSCCCDSQGKSFNSLSLHPPLYIPHHSMPSIPSLPSYTMCMPACLLVWGVGIR